MLVGKIYHLSHSTIIDIKLFYRKVGENMNELTQKNSTGEILRLLRISHDLTISSLSEKTKISKSYITEIEKGVKTPSDKIIKNYSIGLKIPESTLNYLLKEYSQEHLPYQKLLLIILKNISEL